MSELFDDDTLRMFDPARLSGAVSEDAAELERRSEWILEHWGLNLESSFGLEARWLTYWVSVGGDVTITRDHSLLTVAFTGGLPPGSVWVLMKQNDRGAIVVASFVERTLDILRKAMVLDALADV